MALSLDFLPQIVPTASVAHSKQYFQNVSMLPSIGFANMLTADTFVDTSFEIKSPLAMKGALISTFTKDSVISDSFICYEIPLTPKYQTQYPVFVELHESKYRLLNIFRGMVKGVPWIPLIVFNILLLLLPALIESILSAFNIFALMIVGIYYIGSVIQFARKFVKSETVSIQGQSVTYADIGDILVLGDRQVEAMIPLKKFGVTALSIYQNTLYIKQSFAEHDFMQTISSINLSAQERENQSMEAMKQTIEYLLSENVRTALFSDSADGSQ
ncbi:MAG TPA: hypothetical protein PKC14_04025 [Candidatus Absconditabacterales bacterium]|nr:hypothetical protein [Candidatus Absconditabacterales bacterium]